MEVDVGVANFDVVFKLVHVSKGEALRADITVEHFAGGCNGLVQIFHRFTLDLESAFDGGPFFLLRGAGHISCLFPRVGVGGHVQRSIQILFTFVATAKKKRMDVEYTITISPLLKRRQVVIVDMPNFSRS